ncbi:MAG: hypothetical protein ACEY3J_01525 [Arsenophonus sp.]
MTIKLHRQETTIHKIITAIQASKKPTYTLAKCYGIHKLTVAKVQK